MNIRDAILQAADHIENHPQSYNFDSWDKPERETPGCMWGWIGAYAGIPAVEDEPYTWTVSEVLGHSWAIVRRFGISGYTSNPVAAAKALRLYANEYHRARS